MIHDITLPLRPEHPPWPGDVPFSAEPSSSTANGDECNVSRLAMSSHFATHLDAPFHFEHHGRKLDRLSLESLVGPVLIHETNADPLIEAEHLPDLSGVERVIFKTRNTHFIADSQFHADFVALGLSGAKTLTRQGVKLVGIDYFSIEAFKNPGHPVHHELCGNDVIIVEGLDLRTIEPGWYELTVLPLKIQNGDGSPCRAILRETT